MRYAAMGPCGIESVLALLLIALVGLVLVACGANTRTTASVSAIAKLDQVTTVSTEFGPLDPDDDPVLKFGRPASMAESREITAVLKRYYEIAVAEDGAKACSMLSLVAVREVVGEDGRLPGSSGTTCPVIVTKLFKEHHQRLALDLKSFKVLRVRTEGNEARVVLRFATFGVSRDVFMIPVGGTWKLRQPLDEPLP